MHALALSRVVAWHSRGLVVKTESCTRPGQVESIIGFKIPRLVLTAIPVQWTCPRTSGSCLEIEPVDGNKQTDTVADNVAAAGYYDPLRVVKSLGSFNLRSCLLLNHELSKGNSGRCNVVAGRDSFLCSAWENTID
jgi:hypothetical protein